MDAGSLQGRDGELSLLGERLTSAAAGRGGVAVVTGEAGIGKSALTQVVAGEAEKRRFQVLTGRSWEFADAPAYFPVKSGLRALGVASATPASSDADAFGLWEDVLEALGRESAKRPILWLIEDLHAADAQTVDLLSFLAHPLRAMSVLVVVTVRTGDARATGAVLQRLMRLTRDSDTIQLASLREADVAALAARIAGRALPTGSIGAWMGRTGGNPLFVVECARAVRAGRSVEGALPDTVVEAVVERLGTLPGETRERLQQAALLGREFTAAAVARLAGLLPAVVIDGLLPALRAGLLEELAPGRFRFGHALVHEAIEEAIPAGERPARHARVEAELAAYGDSAAILALRARHAILALGVLPEEEVERVVVRAVAALEAEGARDRSFALWRRWTDARLGQPSASALLELSRLATAAGNHGEAQRAASSAFALAKLADDPAQAARAALALGSNPLPGIVDAPYVRVLEEALARLAAANEPRLTCVLRARLAAAMQPAAEPAVPVAMARDALAAARAIGDDELLREVLVVAGSAMTYFVDAAEGHGLAGELLALSLAKGDTPRTLRAFARCVVGHLELGDFAAFEADTDRMLEQARATGHPSLIWRPLLIGSMRALAHGNFAESERLVTEIEETSGLIDDPALTLSLAGHKAYRTFSIDDEDAIRAALANAIPPLARAAGAFGATLRGLFAVRLDDRAAAADEIPALLQIARRLPSDSPVLGLVGETVALAGTLEQRSAIYAQLLPLEGREHHTAPIPYTYEGPFSRILGLLELSLGRIDAGEARLERARQRCRERGLRPWVARLSLERGRVLQAAGRAEGRSLLDEARALAEELGMKRIEALARRARDGDRAPAAVASAPPGEPLAPLRVQQEGEVWKVAWEDRVVRVRDSRGVQLLAKLVASPGERMHVLALAGEGDALPASDAGVALDPKAIAAYRARLTKIDDMLAVAEGKPDGRRLDQLQRERDLLVAEIARAVGLGGRLRKVGSATERARINVTRRLRDAIARIAEADARLGRHLDSEIRTGTYCSYLGRS